jgi:hypothetical protein
MRNVRKSLIVGVLLIEVAFGAFLLLQERDRSASDTDVPKDNPAQLAATSFQSSSQLDDTHMTAGSVAAAAPLAGRTATDPNQVVSGTVVTQSGSPAKVAVQAPLPETRPQPQPRPEQQPETPPRESVALHAAVAPRSTPVPRVESRRDDSHRQGANPVASAMTDQLVKESAQLDPALPPPPPQYSRNDPHRPGSNPVAAAMTDQLVRQSAKLDPALPPPNQPNLK